MSAKMKKTNAKKTTLSTSTAKTKPTTPPKTKLKSIYSLKVHLAWAIRELENGHMDPKVLNSLTMALNAFAGIINGSDFEDRIKLLEESENESCSCKSA